MNVIPIFLGILSGLCLGTGVIFLFTGLRRPGGDRLHILFALFALAYSGSILTAILSYKAISLEAYMRVSRWTALSTVLTLIFLLWFVAYYTGVRPRVFLVPLTAILAIVGVVAIFRPNFIHEEIIGLVQASLPWGETIALLDATESIWEIIFFLSELALVGYLIYAFFRQFIAGERRAALALGLGLFFLMFALVFDIAFIDSGALNFIYLGDYGFTPLMIVMGLRLSNQVIRTEQELADYRENLEIKIEERTAELQTQINERKRAEIALRQSERTARVLIDAPPDSAILIDPDGTILAINQIGASRLGIQVPPAPGTNAFDLIEPDLAAARKAKVAQAISAKQPLRWTDERDGRFFEYNVYPILDENEDVSSIAIFAADITARKQMKDALQESEEKYRDLVENINDVIYALDINGVVTYVSSAVEALIGYSPSETIGQHFAQFIHPGELPMARSGIEGVVSGLYSGPNEYRVRTKSGETRWLRISSQPVHQADKFAGVRGVLTDITERKRAEEQLHQRLNDLDMLNYVANVITTETDFSIALQRVSQTIVEYFEARYTHIIILPTEQKESTIMFGYDQEAGAIEPEPVDISLDELPLLDRVLHQGEALMVSDPEISTLAPVMRDFLSRSGIESLLLIPLWVHNAITGMMSVSRDQAERPFTAGELSLAETLAGYIAGAIENARLQEQALDTAASEERSRLAHDLHDAVTQTIYSASLIAEVLPQIWARSPEEGQRNLAKLRALVRGALAEMRTLLFALRPAALETADLETLLRQLGDALAGRTRLPVEVAIEGKPELPVAVKVALYRIAQEAINNIEKHSEARQAWIDLQAGEDRAILRIGDNGRGFDPGHTISSRHMGMQIMRERAEKIGARLEIDSSPGKGARLTVTWTAETEEASS
jgi:PAS domain S-box-containing protein